MAHRCAEWDGWEEGLVDSILGPEEFEHEWYNATCAEQEALRAMVTSPPAGTEKCKVLPVGSGLGRAVKISSKLPLLQEQEKEKMLNTTGDICGGRGGELGRRLEHWLTVSENESGYADPKTKWANDERRVRELEVGT